MILKNNELKVFYKCKDEISIDIDQAMRKTIEGVYDIRDLGCFFVDFVASGYDHKTGVRELAFQVKFERNNLCF